VVAFSQKSALLTPTSLFRRGLPAISYESSLLSGVPKAALAQRAKAGAGYQAINHEYRLWPKHSSSSPGRSRAKAKNTNQSKKTG